MTSNPNDNRVSPLLPVSSTELQAPHGSVTPTPTSLTHWTDHIYYYILVPVVALVVVALIALIIHLLVKYRRRKWTNRLPVFHYDPQDQSGWESDLLDDTDPPFVRDSQKPIVSLSLQPNSSHTNSNHTSHSTVTA